MKFPVSQLNALFSLYNSTDGPLWHWGKASGIRWNFSNPDANPCADNWQGVFCYGTNSSGVTGIDLGSYGLKGQLLNSFFNISSLLFLNLTDNSIFGELPASLENFASMQVLVIRNNSLSGPMPSAIEGLAFLQEIDLSLNYLSGSLPAFRNMTFLRFVDFSDNALIGPVPMWVDVPLLQEVDLKSNKLNGSLPLWYNMSNLIMMNFGSNLLTGTLPLWTDMNSMEVIDLGYNKLTGTIPLWQNMNNLQHIVMNNNALSGPLNFFASRNNDGLISVELSNNFLTGSIPVALYGSNLQSLSMGINCFSGTISSEICSASSLSAVYLNGASVAGNCQRKLFPGNTISVYLLKNPMTGTIPPCIFEMPQMVDLYLAGSSFSGSLPINSISSSYESLCLENNKLDGVLPSAVQMHSWKVLDLSYNKFKGLLSTDYPRIHSNSSVKMIANRLSGFLPQAIINAPAIDVLQENVFNCNLDRTNLPKNDPDFSIYVCGSYSFNDTLYTWASIMGFMCLVVLGCHWKFKEDVGRMLSRARNWYVDCTSLSSTAEIATLLKIVRTFTLVSSGFLLVVMLPLYVVLSKFYGTQTDKYAWIISVAYSAGYPVGISFSLAILIVFAVGFWCFQQLPPPRISDDKSYRGGSFVLLVMGFLLIDIAIVSSVNVGYAYIALNFTSTLVQIVGIFLSFFKLGWNSIVVRGVVSYLLRLMLVASCVNRDSLPYNLFLSRMETAAVLFNNVISPFVATMLVSSLCFYNTLISANPVTATVPSLDGATIITQFTPAFLYSYQCSSSYISTYAPVYVYMFLTIGAFSPLWLIAIEVCETKLDKSTFWMKILTLIQPKYFMTPELLRHCESFCESESSDSYLDKLYIKIVKRRRIFCGDVFVVRVVSMLTIFLTFGVAVPVVALSGLVAMISFSLVTQCALGRFVSRVRESKNEEDQLYLKRLEDDCKFVPQCFIQCAVIIVPFIYLFYPGVLGDAIGDVAGYKAAFEFMIAPALFPLLVWLGWKLRKWRSADKPSSVADKIELIEVVSSQDITVNPIVLP